MSARKLDGEVERLEAEGWELLFRTSLRRRRTELTFRRPRTSRRLNGARVGLVLCLVIGVLVTLTQMPFAKDPLARVKASADLALAALEDGDLAAADEQLALNRGDTDFAYFLASRATPRVLGDALGSVAGGDAGAFRDDVDPGAYEVAVTDLAGTVALATYGTGHRALPASWTDDFVTATTAPQDLYAADGARADQDEANQQNLLLLLSRGTWSVEFLTAVTTAYWQHDGDEDGEAWPVPRHRDARYAPAPNGTYLTDGVLALTAALTANPAASKWAFTDFLPGTEKIAGSEREVGRFTHFLLFDHRFPEGAEGHVGMTAVLTALSAASTAMTGGFQVAEPGDDPSAEPGPTRDARELRGLAADLKDDGGCSWNPVDYWSCAKVVAAAVLSWIKQWGHLVLDLLSLAAFAPFPFDLIGFAAAGTNATWYAIEGDYLSAGLALAVVVPGLPWGRIGKAFSTLGAALAKSIGVTSRAEGAAQNTRLARVAARFRAASAPASERELAEAGARRVESSPRPVYGKEREAQDELASRIEGATTEETLDPFCQYSCTGRRRVDIYEPKKRRCLEVKIGDGATNFAHERAEVAKDVRLRQTKTCKSIEWHFFPNADGKVGPHPRLRALLLQNRIPYLMYSPGL